MPKSSKEKLSDSNPPHFNVPSQETGFLAILIRVFWMMIGNMALGLCAVFITINSIPYFSVYDFIYWIIVVMLITARYIDVKKLKGLTADGDPATIAHWRRHTVRLILVSLPLWIVSHSLGSLMN
ncbi:MAG: hypothetical protein BWK80_11905 [Desulfobacteraceae bacterium IS3]|nr:MAG: hypothetical protein BWK80_11905 [Desulfobacteraceae bacterium IS3]